MNYRKFHQEDAVWYMERSYRYLLSFFEILTFKKMVLYIFVLGILK